MSALADAAQACWDDLEPAFEAVLSGPYARYQAEDEARGVYWAVSTLCACVAIAEVLRTHGAASNDLVTTPAARNPRCWCCGKETHTADHQRESCAACARAEAGDPHYIT